GKKKKIKKKKKPKKKKKKNKKKKKTQYKSNKKKKGNLCNGESIRSCWQTLLQRQGMSTSSRLVHIHSKSRACSL
ncbi:hypothetical protein ACQP3J_27570, partial [Escherichia coli]